MGSGAFLSEIGVKGLVYLVNSMPPATVLVQKLTARIVKATARFGMLAASREKINSHGGIPGFPKSGLIQRWFAPSQFHWLSSTRLAEVM